VCYCNAGWGGDDCTVDPCPSFNGLMCGGPERGVCNEPAQTCECLPDIFGEMCEQRACVSECENGGTCNHVEGTCECDEEHWRGGFCQYMVCEEDCSGRGKCGVEADFQCKCDFGFDDASFCKTCAPGWTGDLCTTQAFSCHSERCNNNGICLPTSDNEEGFTCECQGNHAGPQCLDCVPGWRGTSYEVSLNECPHGCNERGPLRCTS